MQELKQALQATQAEKDKAEAKCQEYKSVILVSTTVRLAPPFASAQYVLLQQLDAELKEQKLDPALQAGLQSQARKQRNLLETVCALEEEVRSLKVGWSCRRLHDCLVDTVLRENPSQMWNFYKIRCARCKQSEIV